MSYGRTCALTGKRKRKVREWWRQALVRDQHLQLWVKVENMCCDTFLLLLILNCKAVFKQKFTRFQIKWRISRIQYFELYVSEGMTTSGWDVISNNFYTLSQLTPKESFSWRKWIFLRPSIQWRFFLVILPLVNRLEIRCPVVLHQGVQRVCRNDRVCHRRIDSRDIYAGESRGISLNLLSKWSVIVRYRSLLLIEITSNV